MKDEIQIEIVLKGEQALLPVNGAGYCFAQMIAKENGLFIAFGHRGFPGVFIPEEMIRNAMQRFDYALKKQKAEENR